MGLVVFSLNPLDLSLWHAVGFAWLRMCNHAFPDCSGGEGMPDMGGAGGMPDMGGASAGGAGPNIEEVD